LNQVVTTLLNVQSWKQKLNEQREVTMCNLGSKKSYLVITVFSKNGTKTPRNEDEEEELNLDWVLDPLFGEIS